MQKRFFKREEGTALCVSCGKRLFLNERNLCLPCDHARLEAEVELLTFQLERALKKLKKAGERTQGSGNVSQ